MAKTYKGKANITCTVNTLDGKKEVSQHIKNVDIICMDDIVDMDDWNLRVLIATAILRDGLGGFMP